ncbi:hypothetical protein ACSYAD_31960 [Acaryochloris marina NIES-2412]|uniref:hypothetical protein n=1 Tax=Acaryochloris marina TaxID=155978 RepID=UPI004058C7CD
MGHTVRVVDTASEYCGTEGRLERLYWREEVLWIRMRTQAGGWLFLPCRQTDLPQVTATTFPTSPRLSAPVLLQLAQYLECLGQKQLGPTHKPGSVG